MRKLLNKKSLVVAGVVGAVVASNVSFAAADTALVTSIVTEFTALKDTAVELSVKMGPIGVGIVIAIFGVILAVSSTKKVGNVATR